jgi:hypothetical protein
MLLLSSLEVSARLKLPESLRNVSKDWLGSLFFFSWTIGNEASVAGMSPILTNRHLTSYLTIWEQAVNYARSICLIDYSVDGTTFK